MFIYDGDKSVTDLSLTVKRAWNIRQDSSDIMTLIKPITYFICDYEIYKGTITNTLLSLL